MDMKPGDVLMWLVGSKHYTFGHAAMVVEPTITGARIVHTGGDNGITFYAIEDITYPPKWVYQCNHSVLAELASNTAMAWCRGAQTETIQYGFGAAFNSAFARARFRGQGPQDRATQYRLHCASNGPNMTRRCPPSFSRQEGKGSRLFCSMLVIAAYQAATHSNAQVLKYMGQDAIHSSPFNLNQYLMHNRANWRRERFGDYRFPTRAELRAEALAQA